MADTEALYVVFDTFCNFGSAKNLNASSNKLAGPMMEGSKFAKLGRDCGILDSKLTSTDFDIIFNKIKDKSERKITFGQFQECLKLLAAKKYPSKTAFEAYVTLVQEIVKNGSPNVQSKLLGTPSKADSITARLTDPSNFTGTQKATFEARLTSGNSSPNLSKRGYNTVVTASAERLDIQASKPKKVSTPTKSNGNLKTPNSGSKSSVFDRLTDTKGYTGTHKERFDDQGKGLGLAGRDPVAKGSGTAPVYRGGNVNSLSQILRQ